MIAYTIAYTIEGAAAATPLGKDRIREAIRTGDLTVHYHPDSGDRPMILDTELREWIASLPTEKRSS